MKIITFLLLIFSQSLSANHIGLKTLDHTFNDRYEFKLENQKVMAKEFSQKEWTPLLSTPPLNELQIKSIGADNRYIVLITQKNRVLKTKNGREKISKMKWEWNWGHPMGKGDGLTLSNSILKWDIQDWDMFKDKFILNPSNNEKYRTFSIAHIFQIFPNAQRITVHDPWLPADDLSYELCLPHHGNSKVVNFSSSGGFIFLLDQKGNLYSRLWNLDIAGYNQVYARYKYEDPIWDSKKHTNIYQFFRKIRLPSPKWIKQPSPPGPITRGISIIARSKGTKEADLVVEGIHKGQIGLFYKDINAQTWEFRATSKRKFPVFIPSEETPTISGSNYSAFIQGTKLQVTNFKPQCSPSPFILSKKGMAPIELKLHLRGVYRFKAQSDLLGRGIRVRGAIEFPKSLSKQQNLLISELFGRERKKFLEVEGHVSKSELIINKGIPNPISLKTIE